MIQLRCQKCNARLFDGTEKLTTIKQDKTQLLAQVKCRNCGYVQKVYEKAVLPQYEVS